MSPRWTHILEVARFDLLAGGVGSLWLMLALATVEPVERVNPVIGELGTVGAMLLSGVVAVGLVGGVLWMNRATRAAMVMLLIAVAASTLFGQSSTMLGVLAAVGVIIHNIIGRFVPSIGVVTVGLICSVAMAIPNPMLGFGHPIALALTHVMGCAVLLHLYQRKRPRLNTEGGVLLGLGWAFWILLGVSLIGQRRETLVLDAEHAWMWMGPAVALGVWIGVATAMVRLRVEASVMQRAATLWLLLYAAGWLAGAEQVPYAMVMLALALLGWVGEGWRVRALREAEAQTSYRIAN